MSIGISELLIVALLFLFLFKPDKLPEYIRTWKRVSKELRDTSDTIKNNLNDTLSCDESTTENITKSDDM